MTERLWRVWFDYGTAATTHCIAWARDENHLYEVVSWERDDTPRMQYKEITKRSGCVMSITVIHKEA
jgi:hypothetical protein